MEYILDDKNHDGCLFCEFSRKEKNKVNRSRDKKNLILYRSTHCFVILNRYPYNSGHSMVIPYYHTPTFDGLSDDVLFDLIKTVDKSVRVLREVLSPDGFNMGLNFGKVAGAGMESHMHIHVVPRWTGDTDSMPIISETRVMPEHLKKTYNKILKSFTI
jgi:ATP adenylyltransferase